MKYSENQYIMGKDVDNNEASGYSQLFVGELTELRCDSIAATWYMYTDVDVYGTNVKFKLDTGEQANVIPASILDKLSTSVKLQKSTIVLTAFGGYKVHPLGKVTLQCTVRGKVLMLEFYVVKSDTPPILGNIACSKLDLVRKVDVVDKQVHNVHFEDKNTVIEKYSDLFDGLGSMPGQYHIELQQDAVPVIHAPRKVPLSLMDKLKNTLSQMESKKE